MVFLIHLIVSAWSSTNKCANEMPNCKSRCFDDRQNSKEKCLHNQKFELSCLNSYEWIWVLTSAVFVENAFGQACNSWICACKCQCGWIISHGNNFYANEGSSCEWEISSSV